MVDLAGKPGEELLQRSRVGGVERGGAPRVDVERGPLQPLGIATGEDDVSALTTRA
jgi:hypothetical protein